MLFLLPLLATLLSLSLGAAIALSATSTPMNATVDVAFAGTNDGVEVDSSDPKRLRGQSTRSQDGVEVDPADLISLVRLNPFCLKSTGELTTRRWISTLSRTIIWTTPGYTHT
jgi:hypothetical protein